MMVMMMGADRGGIPAQRREQRHWGGIRRPIHLRSPVNPGGEGWDAAPLGRRHYARRGEKGRDRLVMRLERRLQISHHALPRVVPLSNGLRITRRCALD